MDSLPCCVCASVRACALFVPLRLLSNVVNSKETLYQYHVTGAHSNAASFFNFAQCVITTTPRINELENLEVTLLPLYIAEKYAAYCGYFFII
jgi:hypothetical protein